MPERTRGHLLLEIGTEELPPGSVAAALEQLAAGARAALEGARLAVGAVRTTGTGRRLVLQADGLASRQADRRTRVRGPAARIAYDPSGAPTQAAVGFARSQGVPVEALEVEERDGGRYVVAEVREPGRPAREVLGPILIEAVLGLSFPKGMRWGAHGVRFGRPIRWVVALLDRSVVPLEIAGLKSGRRSRGHRFLSAGPVSVRDARAYEGAIRDAHVVLDPAERGRRIVAAAEVLSAAAGGVPVLHPGLLEELVWSVEHPTPLLGRFDPALAAALPREVVLVTLQHHQKCFGVQDAGGKLLPAFIAVRDGGTSHLDSVQVGHEWVVRARLEDARFFLDEDRRRTLEERTADLERLAHAAGLGSTADHVSRLRRLAAWLADAAGLDPADRAVLDRAAALCKTDLVTALVRELPELQGTVGRIYALDAGEPAPVATAIEEHYWPRAAGAPLPGSLPGALLGVADRALLLAGALLAGLEPSGSQDPYGLRRAAAGIVEIARAFGLAVPLHTIHETALAAYDPAAPERAAAERPGLDLLQGRLRMLLTEAGVASDTATAVMAVGAGDVPDAVARAEALHAFRSRPEMARLVTAYRRASRIESQLQADPPAPLDPGILTEPAEIELHRVWQAVDDRVEAAVSAGRYAAAIEALLALADPIDRFFDTVLVMAPDAALRAGRRALLRRVTGTFDRVADLGALVG